MDMRKFVQALTPEQLTELKAALNSAAVTPQKATAPTAPASRFVPPAGLAHNIQPDAKTAVAIEEEVQIDNFLSTDPKPTPTQNPFLAKPLPTTSHEIIRDKYYNTGEVELGQKPKAVTPSQPPLPPPPEGWMPNKTDVRATPGRPLTLADTTGPALKDEFARAKARERVSGTIKQGRAAVDLSDPMVAMCPKELREKQPDNFNPYDLINKRVREFLAQPGLPGGLALTERVLFDQKDRPSVPIENAVMFDFEPVVVLGRVLSSGATKLYVGYAQPGQESLTDALRTILTTLKNWALGKEFVAGEAAANVGGTMKRVDGSTITDAGGRPMRAATGNFVFKPKIHVFQPLDYSEQVAVVIA